MLAISCLLVAAMHPYFSSAFQARRKGRAKWEEIFPSELLLFVSEMENFPRDFVYMNWPEINPGVPTAKRSGKEA